MKQRLFNKFFISMTAIVLLSLTLMMMVMTFMYNRYLASSKYDILNESCVQISQFIENMPEDTEINDVYYVMKNLSSVLDIDVFVTDGSGAITVCSCDTWVETASCEHTGSTLIFDKKSMGERQFETLGIYSEPHYFISTAFEASNGQEGYIVATSPTSEIKSLMKRVIRLYGVVAIVPVLMFAALYFITYRMTRPLKMMSKAAKAMAKGDFSRRIPVTCDDEIGELAVSFNQMTNSLVRLEEMRKSFIANISHELKTPMTTIGGFIDGIIDGTIEPEKQKYYLGIVSEEVKRLSRMVESMLNVSRLESGEAVIKTEKFDFRELLLNIVIAQEQRIEEKGLNIRGLDSTQSVTVNADRDLIHRVVYNLVDNAVKFNNDGGFIDFSLTADTRRMIFRITNSGRGIPAADMPYVFERFYKVDKSRSANKNSTGLGLYIVKTIVKNHGGSITVSGKENEFTSFEITLPLTR